MKDVFLWPQVHKIVTGLETQTKLSYKERKVCCSSSYNQVNHKQAETTKNYTQAHNYMIYTFQEEITKHKTHLQFSNSKCFSSEHNYGCVIHKTII